MLLHDEWGSRHKSIYGIIFCHAWHALEDKLGQDVKISAQFFLEEDVEAYVIHFDQDGEFARADSGHISPIFIRVFLVDHGKLSEQVAQRGASYLISPYTLNFCYRQTVIPPFRDQYQLLDDLHLFSAELQPTFDTGLLHRLHFFLGFESMQERKGLLT